MCVNFQLKILETDESYLNSIIFFIDEENSTNCFK